MEPRIDEMVLVVQRWLNTTYKNDSRFNKVEENGKTGWDTIYGLRRALQIEIDLPEGSDSFGPKTYDNCPNINWGEESNLVFIVQGGLWCKGYSPGGFSGYYGDGTYAAVQRLKADMGFPTASGNMNRDIMKALLDMSAFTCLSGGTEEIRSIQQKLNYDYYDYYQICPCDGLYNREMNKMLIYALQKELGIAKDDATGTWGPTTTSLCKSKTYSIGDSSNIIRLVRYATVCNGFSVSISSSSYDTSLDNVLKTFADSLKIEKPTNKVNYTVIKSLLSSNGDTDRSALGCDTATQLSTDQIMTIKELGYKFIGRYLTKVPGGLDKNLTSLEYINILKNGLVLFPIFQEYGGDNSAFDYITGHTNAAKAFIAARNLGIPLKSTIYFAVDYDPQEADIVNFIIPYFEGIKAYFTNVKDNGYKIGVYGTRNVCRLVKPYVDNMFVSDSSYGFSGNLGFKMPDGWAFDQFCTDIEIGSGSGKVSIDKVAVSHVDEGVSNRVIRNREFVEAFLKAINIDTSDIDSDYTFENETHLFISEPNAENNYTALNVYIGKQYNTTAGKSISFQNGKFDTSAIDFIESTLPGTSSTTKASLEVGLENFGYAVNVEGNNDVECSFSIHATMDRNPGIMWIYETFTPLYTDDDGSQVYLKVEVVTMVHQNTSGMSARTEELREELQELATVLLLAAAHELDSVIAALNDIAKQLKIPDRLADDAVITAIIAFILYILFKIPALS